jgi:ent-kaurenoic acid hydroxylase
MEDLAWWLGILLGAVPLLAFAVWHCNDAFYCAAFALRRRGLDRRLPPGHMGLPFFGETGAMLWRFKVTRRPDGFIETRKKAYGEGVGMYRSHLFGHPTIVVCLPSVNRFVLQAHDSFWVRWPAKDLLGLSSMFNAEGSAHTRIRGYVVASFSQPRSLRNIARVAQPRVAAALRSWAEKGTITAATEFRKVGRSICSLPHS